MKNGKNNKFMYYLFCFMLFSGSIFYFSNTKLIYVFWAFTIIFNAFIVLEVFKKNAIKKKSLIIFFIIILPLIWSWMNFKKFIDLELAFIYTLITIFYTVVCLNIQSFISNIKVDLIYNFITRSSFVWIVLSIIPILIQVLDPLIPVSGLFANRNAFAMICTLILVSNLYILKDKERLKNKGYVNNFNILFLVFFIILSSSVKGFSSLLIVMIVYNRKKLTIKKIIALLFFLISIFLLLTTDSVISERVGYVVNSYSDNSSLRISQSAYIRQFYVSEGLRLILESPLFGIGILQSKFYLIPEYFYVLYERGDLEELVGQYSHNNYIEVGLNGGLFSLISSYLPIMYILFSCIFKRGTKSRLRDNDIDLIYCLIFLKLFNDFGMVTFYQFPYILQLTAIYYLYSKRLY